jgi:hypothetical protein
VCSQLANQYWLQWQAFIITGGGAPNPVSIPANVDPSGTLPAKVLERRTKPLPSSTNVTKGQSVRFLLIDRASGFPSLSPSKLVNLWHGFFQIEQAVE